jgi:hypothetical protein
MLWTTIRPSGQVLGLRQLADRADVVLLDHVVGRLHVERGLVVEALQVAARLGEVHVVDPLVGVALGELERAVGALGRGPVVDDRALDDAPRGALAAPDDDDLAAGVFADERGDLGGPDLDRPDEGVP